MSEQDTAYKLQFVQADYPIPILQGRFGIEPDVTVEARDLASSAMICGSLGDLTSNALRIVFLKRGEKVVRHDRELRFDCDMPAERHISAKTDPKESLTII